MSSGRILKFLALVLIMVLTCQWCKRAGFANTGSLRTHTQTCTPFLNQFSAIRSGAVKRKSESEAGPVKGSRFLRRKVATTTTSDNILIHPSGNHALAEVLAEPDYGADDFDYPEGILDNDSPIVHEWDEDAQLPTRMTEASSNSSALQIEDVEHVQEPVVEHIPMMHRDRRRRLYIDHQPEGPRNIPPPLPTENNATPLDDHSTQLRITLQPARRLYFTMVNSFGTFREYFERIKNLPDAVKSLSSFTSRTTTLASQRESNVSSDYGPCQNKTVFAYFYHWIVLGGEKTLVGMELMQKLYLWQYFKHSEFAAANLRSIHTRLAVPLGSGSEDFTSEMSTGWTEHQVKIAVPLPKERNFDPYAPTTHNPQGFTFESAPNIFTVPGLYIRSLKSVIFEELSRPAAKTFHWTPFKQWWKPVGENEPQRVYDELYSSPAWLEAHDHVQNLSIPGCNLPRAVAALMFWSDSMCLSDFGTKSLWPIYLFFGNQSKYDRSKPSNGAGHHVAFLPTIPDSIHNFIAGMMQGKPFSKDLLTFCKRELMHEAWRLLLDEEFKKGFIEGWVIRCADGVTRRIFPRILTYSADYPEKVLLATIRDKGGRPCPRCLVKMENVHEAGTHHDTEVRVTSPREDSPALQKIVQEARNIIYQEGKPIKSAAVETLLKPKSLVPTVNAFSELFLSIRANFYEIFVVDFLHEFELGVWKAVLVHLVRILHTCGEDRIREFNYRMRETPLFGLDTIRKFSNDVSELKKMAARDYEDILQIIIPAIEGLVPPPHNNEILTLLYLLAEYHTLAKLRMHTESSLLHWERVIAVVTQALRDFQASSRDFKTTETPRERNARVSHTTQNQKSTSRPIVNGSSQPRTLNLTTYKFHAMGDGPSTVRRRGTLDRYSTQTGEREHRVPKAMYKRTSKNRDSTRQVAIIDQKTRNLITIAERCPDSLPPCFPRRGNKLRDAHRIEPIAEEDLRRHHIIGGDNEWLHLPSWLNEQGRDSDPAFKDFRHRLKNHLLSRIRGEQQDEDFPSFPEHETNQVHLWNDRIYTHARMHVLYTTYDLRRALDPIDLKRRPNVMTRSYYPEGDEIRHPFWYAQVQGIYHARVSYGSMKGKRMEFLWVRWYAWDHSQTSGWNHRRLDRLGFDDMEHPFGFLDPAAIIRGAHLIPAWSHDRTSEYFKQSQQIDKKGDWTFHYVNRFVDRDMYLRYHGGGVGHGEGYGGNPIRDGTPGAVVRTSTDVEPPSQFNSLEVVFSAENDIQGMAVRQDESDTISDASTDESDEEDEGNYTDNGMDDYDAE